jgi:hypothetical protein
MDERCDGRDGRLYVLTTKDAVILRSSPMAHRAAMELLFGLVRPG